MIVNDPDLLPLTPPAVGKKKSEDESDFAARVADSYDSIESLLAAREEAEDAEARARAAGETPLPFAKEGKDEKRKRDTAAKRPTVQFTTSNAADESVPSPIGEINPAMGLLADARSIGPSPTPSPHERVSLPPADPDGLAAIPGMPRPPDPRLTSDRSVAAATQDTGNGTPSVDAYQSRLDAAHGLGDIHINELLKLTQQADASDLHLTTNLPPMIRKDGRLGPLPFACATEQDTQRILYEILSSTQVELYERTHELDFSYGVKGIGRFRFNVYRQRGAMAAAMRVIPSVIPTMEQLKLPPILRELTRKHAGLVLVTGPTGSGKSTSIASLIDIINTERECHILTIEDPIEYLHSHKRSMVNQRELGGDTDTFQNALRASLREDPDVILVGEMRDLETIAAAITLAETGHLVFATLHTRCAAATIDRIVDVFPAYQQEQIRIQLATSLEAVVAQQLLPRSGGGRVAAVEIMIATAAIRNLIREGKTYQINSIIETGQQYGMQNMDRMLAELYRAGTVTIDEAATRAIDRENFQRLIKGY